MIEIQNLSFAYRREFLFSGLNLSVKPGGICGLLGKNGAGKTTLMKLLAGLIFPTHGSISIGRHTPSKRSFEFLKDLFYLPEVFKLPPVTPEQYEWLYSPFYPKFSSDCLKDLMTEFEIEPTKKLGALSYGQKKKFIIAFILATNCRLILMDEPTNGLDIPSKSQFRKVVASKLMEDRVFIISTHQARDVENFIDPVIILDQGQTIFNETIETISKKLKIEYQSTLNNQENVLYSEKTFEGYKGVIENCDPDEHHIDLETLFNTVINNSREISRVFKDGRIK